MAKTLHYLVLDPDVGWLPGDKWTSLLGATVKNPLQPTNDYEPENALEYNKQRGLIEEECTDFILKKERAIERDNHLDIKGVGKLRWARKVGEKVRLEGKVIYVKRLQQHDKFWKAVNEQEHDFTHTVAGWVKERDSLKRRRNIVCLVVGLLICEDVVVATTEEEIREHELREDVPLGTIAGLAAASHGVLLPTGGVGDVHAGTKKSDKDRTYFAAKKNGKRIFALQLRIVKSRNGELALTYEEPEAPTNRRLGPEEEGEDDDDDEPLGLEDNWQILLQRQENGEGD